MKSDNLCYFPYNVKGIQQSSKRRQVSEYLKYNSFPSTFFWQETNSSVQDEKQCSDNFKWKISYFHDTANSYSVAIAFLRSKYLKVVETKNDDSGRIFIT